MPALSTILLPGASHPLPLRNVSDVAIHRVRLWQYYQRNVSALFDEAIFGLRPVFF